MMSNSFTVMETNAPQLPLICRLPLGNSEQGHGHAFWNAGSKNVLLS